MTATSPSGSKSVITFFMPNTCVYANSMSCRAATCQIFLAQAARKGSFVLPCVRSFTMAPLSHLIRTLHFEQQASNAFRANSNSNSTFIALNLYLMIDSKTQKAKIRDCNR